MSYLRKLIRKNIKYLNVINKLTNIEVQCCRVYRNNTVYFGVVLAAVAHSVTDRLIHFTILPYNIDICQYRGIFICMLTRVFNR